MCERGKFVLRGPTVSTSLSRAHKVEVGGAKVVVSGTTKTLFAVMAIAKVS